ncbi:MAG: DUF6076 domain-containing protein [Eubacteriales bacterium]|nr:DUF6076 domain-containing protein [Eubacteriales bacterium]MDD4475937.1 DUF6076 domain-containing protein [Eubacteriales bacterium]
MDDKVFFNPQDPQRRTDNNLNLVIYRFSDGTESIDYTFEVFNEKRKEKQTGPVLSAFCDLLSLNFEALSCDIIDLYASNLQEFDSYDSFMESNCMRAEILDLLKKHGILMMSNLNVDRIFNIINEATKRTSITNSESNEGAGNIILSSRFDENTIKQFRREEELLKIKENILSPKYFSDLFYIQSFVEVVQENKLKKSTEMLHSFMSNYINNSREPDKFQTTTLTHKRYTNKIKAKNQIADFIEGLVPYEDYYAFRPKSTEEICIASLYLLFGRDYDIKKCANCGKWFVPLGRSDTLYCDRPSPQDSNRSCKEYGTERLWYDKLKQNESASLWRKISQTKQKMASRYSDIPAYTEQYELFKIESKQWKSDVKNGIKTEEEFIGWLKSQKEKKV